MDVRIPEIAEYVLLIEKEMYTQGLWSDKTPSAYELSSPEPFSVDRLDFEQWVQWIFLPKMKVIIEQEQPYQVSRVSGTWPNTFSVSDVAIGSPCLNSLRNSIDL